MVRCPRADRVAVPSAMIHLLSCGTVDHGRLVWSRQLGADRPPKSVSVRDFQRCPLVDHESRTLNESYCTYDEHSDVCFQQAKRLEEINNSLFIEAYGLQDELSPDIPDDHITL